MERHDGAITPMIAECFFFFFFSFPHRWLQLPIFLTMCGNVPILVGSGIGILYYNASLDEEAVDISLCSEIKKVATTFQIAAHALRQMHRNFYCNLIILQ